jgi:hypothetical protein
MQEDFQNGSMRTQDPNAGSNASAAGCPAALSPVQEAGQEILARSAGPTPAIAVSAGQRVKSGPWRRRPAPPFPPPTGCRRVMLPFYGFVVDADDDHRERVDRFFHIPMLVLSLLVLPILAGQYYFSQRLSHPWIPYLLETAFLMVSVAFLVEFAIKVTIARSRWRYALTNWLDIMIIVLPFLRPFRAARVLRVAQLLPAYSFRGVYGKFIRSGTAVIMTMTLVQRLRGRFAPSEPSPPGPSDYSQWSKAALIAEIQRLHEKIRELRRSAPYDGRAVEQESQR